MGIVIRKNQYNNMLQQLRVASTEEHTELEARFTQQLDSYAFQRVLTYLMSKGYKNQQNRESLDITTNNSEVRVSIDGIEDISIYCKTGFSQNTTAIRKQRNTLVENLDEYNVKIKLSKETPINSTSDITSYLASIKDQIKVFRLKKRTSFYIDSFRVDCTVVRMKEGRFMSTKAFNEIPLSYEIEIEYLPTSEKPAEELLKTLLSYIAEILKVINDCEYLVTKTETLEVLDEYHQLAFSKSLDKAVLERNPRSIMIGPQPVTLELGNLLEDNPITIKKAYTVTPKADGERNLLFVNKRGELYTINNRATIKRTKLKCPAFASSIFDTEVILKPDGKTIMIFDTYFANSSSTCALPLLDDASESRLGVAKKFRQYVSHSQDPRHNITVKEFKVIDKKEDLFTACREILDGEEANNLGFATDGLIFTPLTASVGASLSDNNVKLSGTWERVLKWKSPRDNTIDFLVRIHKAPGSINDEILRNTTSGLCKTLELFVRGDVSNATAWDYWNNNLRREGSIPVRFSPDTPYDMVVDKTTVDIDTDGFIRCANKDIILDDSIVECSWDADEKKWLPMRIRLDKTELFRAKRNIQGTANDQRVAERIWNTIINPVTVEHITGVKKVDSSVIKADETKYYANESREREKSDTFDMVNFHNIWVKNRHLLARFKNIGASTLADFGCGKGGDLFKWVDANFTKVFGLDLYSDNINNPQNGIYKRLYELGSKRRGYSKLTHTYLFLPFDLSKRVTKENVNEMPNEQERLLAQIAFGYANPPSPALRPIASLATTGFDVVSCQFAIHYFFRSLDTLDNFVFNIDKFVRPGGYFIGTCFDGKALARDLDNLPNGEDTIKGIKNGKVIWSIQRKYESPFQENTPGQVIKVYMESINQYLDEYLVDFNMLISQLQSHDINLLSTDELAALGLNNSTGMFGDLFNEMISYVQSKKGNVPSFEKWMVKAIDMSSQEKQLSFYNRWFIFRRKPIEPTKRTKGAKKSNT